MLACRILVDIQDLIQDLTQDTQVHTQVRTLDIQDPIHLMAVQCPLSNSLILVWAAHRLNREVLCSPLDGSNFP